MLFQYVNGVIFVILFSIVVVLAPRTLKGEGQVEIKVKEWDRKEEIYDVDS